MKNKSILGLIPARGGSKGIPRKNLFLKNKPLIQWTIETAISSGDLNKIIVVLMINLCRICRVAWRKFLF